jgi:glycosyltransferase involved in cell wall biosynthesis
LKILFLISSKGLYGAEKVVLTLAEGMRDKGHQAIIANICKTGDKETAIVREANSKRIESIVFPCRKRIDSRTIRDVKTYVTEQKVDILHSHGYKSNYFASEAARGINLRLVATCHNWTSNNLKMKLYEYIDKKILKKYDQVIAVSSQIRQKLIKGNVPENKIRVIYNGISIKENDPGFGLFKMEYPVPQDVKCIGTIGRLSPEKDQMLLIRAFKKLLENGLNAVLFIVGEGPQNKELHKEAMKLNIVDKVYFTGYRGDVKNILEALDVFVLPSLKEGVPMILLEAMLAKKVIVATEVGEVPSILGVNGVLCPPGNQNLLESSINRAILMSTEEKAKIGENAYNIVIERYSQNKMVVEYEKVYQGLLSQ